MSDTNSEKTNSDENLDKFPSAFQMARNLAKQAYTSVGGMMNGKPLLTSAETAYSRIQICEKCEFYKDTRCLKCGCYMHKKAHLEMASCPVGKWGEFQSHVPSTPPAPRPPPPVQRMEPQFSPEEKAQYDMLIEHTKKSDVKWFDFKGKRYTVTNIGEGRIRIQSTNLP